MKKLLFSLLALAAVTMGAAQAQQVMQRHVGYLQFAEANNGTPIAVFAYFDVIFESQGGQPVRFYYSTSPYVEKLYTNQILAYPVVYNFNIILIPDMDNLLQIDYTWEWDLSLDPDAHLSGRGKGSGSVKISDFQYDWSLPDEPVI